MKNEKEILIIFEQFDELRSNLRKVKGDNDYAKELSACSSDSLARGLRPKIKLSQLQKKRMLKLTKMVGDSDLHKKIWDSIADMFLKHNTEKYMHFCWYEFYKKYHIVLEGVMNCEV